MAQFCWELERRTTARMPPQILKPVKVCLLAILEDVVTNDKVKTNIISPGEIPTSDRTTIRRVKALAPNVFKALLDKLKPAGVMTLAVHVRTVL